MRHTRIFLTVFPLAAAGFLPLDAQINFAPTASPRAPGTAAVFSPSTTLKALATSNQPNVTSVNDAADYSLVVAPGSLAVVFGSNLSTANMSAPSIPLNTSLGGTTVNINGRSAPLLYVSPGQINLQIPYETAPGVARVTVSNGSQTSAAFQFLVQATSIGIFGYGTGHGIVQNADYSLNASGNPSTSGSTVVVYLTGIGVPTVSVGDGAAASGTQLSLAQGTSAASIGGANAPVQFLGLTPGLVGLAQANITVPNLPTGDYPLTITISGHQSTSVIISVGGSTTAFQPSSVLSLVSSVGVANGTGAFLALEADGVSGGSVAIYGNYLYVCGTSNVNVVDVTNPASPKLVYEFGDNDLLGNAGYEILFSGGCAVKSSGTLPILTDIVRNDGTFVQSYDLTNPVKPVPLSKLYDSTDLAGIVFNGDTGFFYEDEYSIYGNGSVYQTMGYVGAANYSNASAPSIVSYLQQGSAPASNSAELKVDMMIASPSVLYMAGSTAANGSSGTGVLDVYNITSPANIQAISQIQVPGTGMEVSLASSGNQLIVVGSTSGLPNPGTPLSNGAFDFPLTGNLTLTFFDISNPAAPAMQGNFYFATLSPDGCRAASLGGGFYVLSCGAPDVSATGEGFNGSLYVLDTRNAAAPTAYLYGTIEGLGGITVSNGYLYAATTAGANIYKIQTP